MRYNWQQSDWPDFSYDETEIEDLLYRFAEKTGRLSGAFKTLPENTRIEVMIDAMVTEAIKTSEIEGEYFDRKDVKSSIRNKLGLNTTAERVRSMKAKGAGELMVEVLNAFAEPLTEETLFYWHRLLFFEEPDISIGAWRTHEDPMQVISGPLSRRKVHFEAPPSKTVPREMKRFISWFNQSGPGGKREIKKAPLRAAITHLYFESIHPFEDGNGRIGRAVSEKALSQSIGKPAMLSLSQAIEAKKRNYYNALERAQRSNEITPWLQYFINTIISAQEAAEDQVDFILGKARFFDRFKAVLNERQLMAVRRMLDEGPGGFEGGMSARKYIGITKVSKATATRDLQQLVEAGALKPAGGGRSTCYDLVLESF